MNEAMKYYYSGPPNHRSRVELYQVPKKGTFLEAVDHIQSNSRAMKLLTLMEGKDLAEQEDADVPGIVHKLRERCPTIEDVQTNLSDAVDAYVGVSYEEGWTQADYAQATRQKKLQYKTEAVPSIVKAIDPLYKRFGAVSSEENKARILTNVVDATERIAHQEGVTRENISLVRNTYHSLKNNIFAATKQQLTRDEARELLRETEMFFSVYNRFMPESLDREIESAIQKIKDMSGLTGEDTQSESPTIFR